MVWEVSPTAIHIWQRRLLILVRVSSFLPFWETMLPGTRAYTMLKEGQLEQS